MESIYIQIFTTTDRKQDADRIASALVEQRLAACVQISGPVTSTYRWEGAIEQADEYLLIAKSRQDLFDRAEKAIREIHTYDVPEILAVPISNVSADYLTWLEEELSASRR